MSRASDVVFETDALGIGVAFLPGRRRVTYRSVYGIERSAGRLWIGTRWAPAVLGGSSVSPDRLDAIEAELRQRIAALPDGAERLRRIDARRAVPLQLPWLAPALALLLGLLFVSRGGAEVGLVTDLLWLLAFGLLVEGWLGRWRLVASGGAALLAAALAGPPRSGVELAALATRALPLAWIGLLVLARALRDGALGVRVRSALDTGVLLVLAFGLRVLVSGPSGSHGLALLAGVGVAALTLRRWPPDARSS